MCQQTPPDAFARAKASCNYCGVCGHTPRGKDAEPNRAPIRWWDGDDGWKIGTLCRHCWEEVQGDRPKADDYAVATATPERRAQILAGVPAEEHVNTDEDPLDAM